jgi:hypothetical protein
MMSKQLHPADVKQLHESLYDCLDMVNVSKHMYKLAIISSLHWVLIRLSAVSGDQLQCVFTHIDRDNHERICYFLLKLLDGKQYEGRFLVKSII